MEIWKIKQLNPSTQFKRVYRDFVKFPVPNTSNDIKLYRHNRKKALLTSKVTRTSRDVLPTRMSQSMMKLLQLI